MDIHEFAVMCIDIIFPPGEDALTLRKVSPDDMDHLYTEARVDDVVALSVYAESCVRALIHEAKFHGNMKAFQLLRILVQKFLRTHAAPVNLLIPVPLSRARMRTRGFNQVHEVLKTVRPALPISPDALTRHRDTRPQTELSRAERLTNLHDAFSVPRPENIAGKHILLIDDVVTTGATLRAAKAALLPHAPASVMCVALAH